VAAAPNSKFAWPAVINLSVFPAQKGFKAGCNRQLLCRRSIDYGRLSGQEEILMSLHRPFQFASQFQLRASALALMLGLSGLGTASARAALHRHHPAKRQNAVPELKDMLLKSPDVGTNLDVKVQKGVVTLSGSVSNLYTKLAAVHLAKRQAGVKKVVDHLKVAPVRGASHFPADAELSQKIQSLLAYDSFLGIWDLRASVKNGRVTLKGELPSRFHRGRAARLAARVNGVKSLADEIRVQSHPKGLKDSDVARSVRQSLSRNPLLARQSIKVEVQNGVVELQGQVNSWKQAKLASRLAYQGGAKIVRNLLDANATRSVSASIPTPGDREAPSATGAR
jgi:osmotically-inducible protein OsmY